jgi:hypothetical protein
MNKLYLCTLLVTICLATFAKGQEKEQGLFGNLVKKEFQPNVAYQADSDGFLLVNIANSSIIKCGTSKDKLVTRVAFGLSGATDSIRGGRYSVSIAGFICLSVPVAKGEYWIIEGSSVSVNWLPVFEITKKLDQEIVKIQQYLLKITNELPKQIATQEAVKAMKEQLKTELREQIKKEVLEELSKQRQEIDELCKQLKQELEEFKKLHK